MYRTGLGSDLVEHFPSLLVLPNKSVSPQKKVWKSETRVGEEEADDPSAIISGNGLARVAGLPRTAIAPDSSGDLREDISGRRRSHRDASMQVALSGYVVEF